MEEIDFSSVTPVEDRSQFCRESVIFLLIGLDWLWFKIILVFVARSSLRFQAVSNPAKTACLRRGELFVVLLVTAPQALRVCLLQCWLDVVMPAKEGVMLLSVSIVISRVVLRCFTLECVLRLFRRVFFLGGGTGRFCCVKWFLPCCNIPRHCCGRAPIGLVQSTLSARQASWSQRVSVGRQRHNSWGFIVAFWRTAARQRCRSSERQLCGKRTTQPSHRSEATRDWKKANFSVPRAWLASTVSRPGIKFRLKRRLLRTMRPAPYCATN